MKLGSKDISKVYLGSKEISKVYLGSKNVYTNTRIPYESDLNLWIKTRSGLSMIDDFGNNSSIIPACGVFNSTNYILHTLSDFGSADLLNEFEFRFYFDGTNNVYRLFSSCDTGSTNYWWTIYIANRKLYFDVKKIADVRIVGMVGDIATGWHTIKCSANGTAYSVLIDGVNQTLTASTGSNDGKLLSFVPNRDNVSFGCKKSSTAVTANTATCLSDYIKYNSSNKWIFVGVNKYSYDIIGSVNVAWTGTSHLAFNASAGTYMLDYGYSLWRKDGEVNEYVPYKNGVPYDISSFLVGYEKLTDNPARENKHNLAPSMINIVGDNWDRSNTTIFNDSARAGYYDASNPNRWVPSELNYMNLSTLFNEGYEGLDFVKFINNSFNPLYLDEIIGYTTNKTESQINSILRYTKDYSYEVFDEIFDNSVELGSYTGFKTRNPFSRYSFYTSANYIAVKANPTLTAIPTYASIAVFVNGVYNQSKIYSSWGYQYITLPQGNDKLITLVEGATSKPSTEVLGCFITSIKFNGSYIKALPSSANERLVFLVDSIGCGQKTTTPAIQSFPNLFHELQSKDVASLGWGFGSIYDMGSTISKRATTVARLQTLFGNATTKKIIIQLGTNDAAVVGVTPVNFKTYYGALLDAIYAAFPDITIYCFSPIFRNDAYETSHLIDYRININDLCSTRDFATYIEGGTVCTYPEDYDDNVHVNNSGMPKIYTAINNLLN